MENWLECTVSQGQFSGEFAVSGQLFDGGSFSLFVAAEDVDLKTPPEAGESVEGLLRIVQLEEKEGLWQIVLPQETFENGQIVTVKADLVRSKGR